ncbi:hypothetical protein [Rhodohalobacter sp. 8-1]
MALVYFHPKPGQGSFIEYSPLGSGEPWYIERVADPLIMNLANHRS